MTDSRPTTALVLAVLGVIVPLAGCCCGMIIPFAGLLGCLVGLGLGAAAAWLAGQVQADVEAGRLPKEAAGQAPAARIAGFVVAGLNAVLLLITAVMVVLGMGLGLLSILMENM